MIPHFWNLNEDPSLTAMVIHFCREGKGFVCVCARVHLSGLQEMGVCVWIRCMCACMFIGHISFEEWSHKAFHSKTCYKKAVN